MKKFNKVITTVIGVSMVAAMFGCGSKTPDATNNDATASDATGSDVVAAGAASKEEAEYVVGICQLLQHPALDAATQGFKDALKDKLGDKVKAGDKLYLNNRGKCLIAFVIHS